MTDGVDRQQVCEILERAAGRDWRMQDIGVLGLWLDDRKTTRLHVWTPGDAVIWDNRRLMHRACPWDMRVPRIMYHSRIAGDPVSEFAAAG